MKRRKIFVWILVMALLLSNFTMLAYATEVEGSIVEETIAEETTVDVTESESSEDMFIEENEKSLKRVKKIGAVNASSVTLSSSTIASYFNSKVGQSVAEASCLAFIANGFAALGATKSTADCAYEYANSHIMSTSMDNIPIGADVFLNWNSNYGGPWYKCKGGNHYCHHIAVYVGDGYIVHTSGSVVRKHTIAEVLSWGMDFRGWGYHGNVIIDSNGSGETISLLSNTGVTNITDTTAKINSKFLNDSVYKVSEIGFYYGTSPDNMTKVVEAQEQNAKTIFYTLGDGKWCGPLTPGTTYYYRIYAVINGVTHMTEVDSFTTMGTSYNDPIGCVDSLGGMTGQFYLTGWALDKDLPTTPLDIHVYIGSGDDRECCAVFNANVYRGDVESAYPGTGSNHGFEYTITTNKTGYQNVDVFAINIGGGTNNTLIGSGTVYIEPDTTKPVVTNAYISQYDKDGYTVVASASDNVGIQKVEFATWHEGQTVDDVQWYQGAKNPDGTYSYRVNVSDFDNWEGMYYTHVYAWDMTSNASEAYCLEQIIDRTPPTISDVSITDVNGSGFTVNCTVEDASEIDRVQFPTWTVYNHQDDLVSEWWINSAVAGEQDGERFSFRVEDNEHNYERGLYSVHIYAYDTYGNSFCYELDYDFQNQGTVVNEASYNGSIYRLFDDKMTWEEAKQACEDMGGHLVTITSAEEQNVVQSLIPVVTTSTNYYIGGYVENSESRWVTGERFEYSNFVEGQPDNWDGIENVYVMRIDGFWNDVSPLNYSMGYICEFDADEPTSIELSETYLPMRFGTSETLSATVLPEGGNYPKVTWQSENENIATVQFGCVSAVGYGETQIIAECGGQQASCTVVVLKPVESISLNLTELTLYKNENGQLTVDFIPEDATEEKAVVWNSSNPDVATVNSDGVVTANAIGTTQIIATCVNDADIKAFCEVTVKGYVVSFETNGGTNITSIECGKDEYIALPEEPTKDGYAFTGWYKDEACTQLWDEDGDRVNSDVTLYAGWMEYHEGLWVVGINENGYTYTGKAIKPEVRVYDYSRMLEPGKDYTISYKNNVKANDASVDKTAPTIIIKGKGNYKSKETVTFKILPKNITDGDITASDIVLNANNKTQKPVPAVMCNGKKLKNKTDFTVEYVELVAGENGANKEVGIYTVLIKGKGNYIGERTVTLTITENKLMSKATVSKIKDQNYTGVAIKPSFTVKSGKTSLVEGTDYTVTYQNNIAIGTATIILTGKGGYSGEKKVTFKIKGTSISKATVTGIPKTVEYNGAAITIESVPWGAKPILTIKAGGEEKTLKEGVDYTISYQKNTDKGTATILFKGINGYSGTLKKSFKITAYNIATDSADMVNASVMSPVAYEKGGSKPDVEIYFNGKLLKNGQDYTLKYRKNQAITWGTPSAEVVVCGKGNFTGKITKNFQIEPSNMEENVTLMVADKAFSTKKGGYRSEPVLTDGNGKKLVKNKDYYKDIKYFLVNEDGSESLLLKDSVAEVGSLIKVYVEGCSNYEGTLSATYVITPISFNKTKIKIAAQEYTGQEVTLDKSDITIKYQGTTLQESDYEIMGYSNNIKKGKAKVTIKGVGNYGGTKTVTFTIKSQGFLWWWR